MIGSVSGPASTDSSAYARREAWGWIGLITLAIFAAYWPSWQVPLLFDDLESITRNSSLRSPWNWAELLSPPASVPTKGRPLANLSFAGSFALSGVQPWGHHALNLAFHLGSAWMLFGVVRRTLVRAALENVARPTRIAGLAASLWAVHPVMVQSVSYLSQRTELMMAFFALTTLYGFIRWAQGGSRRWAMASVVAALLGSLSKEGFVTVPVLVLVYDRTFLAGSFLAAWRLRRIYYAGLALVWPVVFVLLADVGSRGVGLGQGIGMVDYARTQLKAWAVYLHVIVWPYPLVFDRGTVLMASWIEALPYLGVTAAFVGAAAWFFWRRTAVGFLLVAFCLLLLPTSSFVPIAGATIAENRVYLPAAAVVVLLVSGWGALSPRTVLALVGSLAVAAGMATAVRNLTFRNAVGLWRQTVARAPENARAHNNLGELLGQDPSGRDEARRCYETAIRLKPDYAYAHQNLGILRARQPGGLEEGIAHLREALRLEPNLAAAHSNLGILLARWPEHTAEAMRHHDEAVRLDPRMAEAWYNRGNALAGEPSRWPEALDSFSRAIALDPTLAEAHANRAGLLAKMPGRAREAEADLAVALRLRPEFAEAQLAWADLLALRGDAASNARHHYEEALRLRPDLVAAHFGLANLLAASTDGIPAAIAHYEAALRLNPDVFEVHANLAALLERDPARLMDALRHHRRSVELAPDNAIVHFNLAAFLEQTGGSTAEVRQHYARALELKPDLEPARNALQRLGP